MGRDTKRLGVAAAVDEPLSAALRLRVITQYLYTQTHALTRKWL